MKNLSKLAFVALALVCCTSSAYGLTFKGILGPEVDPGLAVSALTLLGGTLAVLRSRRKK